MKAKIGGRTYDTSTAKRLAYLPNGVALYKKQDGEFFLANDVDYVMPLTRESVEEIAEREMIDIDALAYPDVAEAPSRQVSAWIDAETLARAKALGVPNREIYEAGVKALEGERNNG